METSCATSGTRSADTIISADSKQNEAHTLLLKWTPSEEMSQVLLIHMG